MYEFAGAGPCPFPGQLQYRVRNPRGASVFFEKNFATPIGPPLPAGLIVCGTPRTDPSGMSSYVVELSNGYASALDFEQLTSAAPAPVLASGDYYAGDGVSSMPPHVMPATGCPVGTYWDDFHGKCIPVIPPPPAPPVPLTSSSTSGYYAGISQPLPACGPGEFRDPHTGACVPTIPMPPPQAPDFATSGYYAGDAGDISPDLYGVDALKKGCNPGTYWDGWYQKCTPVSHPAPPAPAPDTLPPTLADWHAAHAVGGHGRIRFCYPNVDVLGSIQDRTTCYPTKLDADNKTNGFPYPPTAPGGQISGQGGKPRRVLVSDEAATPVATSGYYVGAEDVMEFVGAAVSDGVAAADNAKLQAQSAKLAATHPDAKNGAATSAQAAAHHANQAASHAQAAMTHPSPEGAVAHAQQAGVHAQHAAAHAADAHAAAGNPEAVGAFYVGAAAGAQHPAVKAQAHADHAVKQAASAHAASSHPAAHAGVHQAAHAATSHAVQAQRHAQAARSHGASHAGMQHARAAERHTHAAAAHAMRAHAAARGREFGRGHEGFGRGFGRGHEGFARGRGGFGQGFGRWGGRGWGVGRWGWGRHPQWQFGVAPEWTDYGAQCIQRDEDSGVCLKEMITWPAGEVSYRITPAGEQMQIALESDEQTANDQVQQQTGTAVPTTDSGLLPGSEQSSDGSASETAAETASTDTSEDQTAQTTANADQASADASQATADAAASDAADGDTSTQGDFAGWQMQFTDPYGYFNMATVPAWDSAYAYQPSDYPPWHPINWW